MLFCAGLRGGERASRSGRKNMKPMPDKLREKSEKGVGEKGEANKKDAPQDSVWNGFWFWL
jgi:hypothetical protein